jgi:hypothetical protein
MNGMASNRTARWLRIALAALALAAAGLAPAQPNGGAAALRERHAALESKLADNAFRRPLVLESTEDAGNLKGDIYAVVEHPYAVVRTALTRPANWCDILMLHLNIKGCRASESADRSKPSSVVVHVGKKYDQPIEQAFEVDFDYRVAAQGPDFLQVLLNAENGPLGTNNYRIVLEAVPLDAGHAFIHLAYSYGYGFAARVAMKGYLATIGSGKVGFSVTGKDAEGKPQYVGGVRGVVERNTMRYYLAIDAYLDALASPKTEQQDKRLAGWFAATEAYARQLHEMDEDEYLTMKRNELKRQAGQ